MALDTEYRLAEEMEALDRDRPDAFADISHELRTPLTSIAGYVELLRDEAAGPLTPAQQKMLATVGRNAAKLWQVIENVLTLAKIEATPFRTTRSPVNLTQLMTEAVADMQSQAAAQGVALTTEGAVHTVTVSGDAGQLHHLLTSLLSDALAATPRGGSVQARCESDGSVAVLDISGRNATVAPCGQGRLAPRPRRAPRSVTKPEPAGGPEMAMCRAIVANHGGGLTVTSQRNRGTSATARLPLAGTASGNASPDSDAVGCYA